MRDYTGKTVFVGIDVHKKTYAVTCLCEKVLVKRDTLKASPKVLVDYLMKYFPGASLQTAYEAGFSGFVLHRYLVEQGIENRVVHAASIEISARDRVKTDKRDSLKIATQLSSGRLKGIHVPSPQREAYRELSRLREKVSQDRSRVGTRLKSLLCRQGLFNAEDDDTICPKWLKKVATFDCDPTIKYSIQVCINEWLFLNEQIKAMDKELHEQACEDKALEKVYRSVPGIGPVHARALANELEDMAHFSNEKHLFSFTGLTPSEHSSGEHKRLGHISRQGRARLRKILVQAAWVAIYQDPSLKAIFDRVSQTAGKKRAIVGIARRLIGQIRGCFKSHTLYRKRQAQTVAFCPQTGEVLQGVNAERLRA